MRVGVIFSRDAQVKCETSDLDLFAVGVVSLEYVNELLGCRKYISKHGGRRLHVCAHVTVDKRL